MIMTIEEVKKKAAEDYPIGTKYISLDVSGVERKDEIETSDMDPNNIGSDHVEVGRGYIYVKGKWATVVSKPEKKCPFKPNDTLECLEDHHGGPKKGEICIVKDITPDGMTFKDRNSTHSNYEDFKLSSKVLIFNDIYVGDVVVCIFSNGTNPRKEGDMFQTLKKSYKNNLSYKEGYTSNDREQWRKATPEEEEAYNKGIRNIKDIPAPVKAPQFVTPQFEVGKWYGNIGKDNKCYGKFLKSENGNFYVSETIDPNGIHVKCSNDTYWDKTRCKDPILADLSEIQQYLPEGHVDKIPTKYTPKKGDYFVVDGLGSLEGRIMLCRYDIYSDEIRSTGPFIGDFNTPKNLTFSKLTGVCFGGSKDRKVRPATQDEIEWLEACIKANKFIPKEEALRTELTELTQFPPNGKCEPVNLDLVTFLDARPSTRRVGSVSLSSAKGIAWNESSHWYYTVESGKKEYKLEELEKFLPKLETMDLLEEAKKRYPIGTKYWNLDMAGNRSNPSIDIEDLPEIPEGVKFIFGDTKSVDGKPVVLVKGPKTTHGWVYSNGKWAEIVSSIPEYVEALQGAIDWFNTHKGEKPTILTKGRVYKFPDGQDDNGESYSWNKDFSKWEKEFKPSTKEAYEAQNKPKTMKKDIKEIKYPGVFHIETEEQWKQIAKYHPKIIGYSSEHKYYLTEGKGVAKERKLYEGLAYPSSIGHYDIYEFSDITFPVEATKEPELIEGQWYEGTSNHRWLFKFHDRKQKDVIWNYKCCTPADGYKSTSGGNWSNLTNIKPANMEEVYRHFPEERPKEKENWCVKITDDNREIAKAYLDPLAKKGDNWSYFNNWYYGLDNSEVKGRQNAWGTPLTTEDFYKKTGHVTEKPMSELTSLPDKWCILPKSTEEAVIIGRWFDARRGDHDDLYERNKRCIYHTNAFGTGDVWYDKDCKETRLKNIPEITFEQFKKWVLKQPKEQFMENYTGRWIKILRSSLTGSKTEAGKYYRIKKHTSGRFELDIDIAPYVAESENAHYEIMPIGWTPETEKVMKYKIGDLVTILNVDNYKTDSSYNGGIPRELMIHGTATLHKTAPNAKIVDIYKEYYIVNFINDHGGVMQLGFLEKDIILREEKKYRYKVVHCRTKEQWDFVNSKLPKEIKLDDEHWNSYKENNTCKDIEKREYTNRDYYERNNSLIYSFEEWCTKFGHVFIPKEIPTTTPIPKFSIGQKLKVCKKKQDVNGWGYAPLSGCTERIYLVGGDEGEVRKINVIDGRNYYELKCHSAYRGICEDCLTLVGESVTSSVSELWPVGTKVIINPNSEYAYQSNGTEGKITKHNVGDHCYQVEWGKGGNNCYRRTDLLLANIKENGPVEPKATIMVDAEVTHIRLPKSASVTLKNTEREVNILVKTKQTIKLN